MLLPLFLPNSVNYEMISQAICTCDDLSAHDINECLLVFVLSDVQL